MRRRQTYDKDSVEVGVMLAVKFIEQIAPMSKGKDAKVVLEIVAEELKNMVDKYSKPS